MNSSDCKSEKVSGTYPVKRVQFISSQVQADNEKEKKSIKLSHGDIRSTVKLAYTISEPTERSNNENIILIHGAIASKETWYKISKGLAQETGMKVYAIDLRNHGDSPWSDDFDVITMANDVDDFMKEHKIPSAILVGHSLGGIVAMFMALSKPERITKLIVEDSTFKPLGPESGKKLHSIMKLLKTAVSQVPANVDIKTARKCIQDFMDSFTPKELQIDSERKDESVLSVIKTEDGTYKWKANIDVIIKFVSDIYSNSKHVNLVKESSYGKETLFLCGGKSLIKIINDKDYLLKLFPEAEFKTFEDASHHVHTEYPDEFCATITGFIRNS